LSESRRVFRFSVEATVGGLVAAGICFSMAVWQYRRYEFKLSYFQALQRQEARGIVALNERPKWSELHHARVRLAGHWDRTRGAVVLNRSNGQQPGVKLVHPLQVEGLGTILVDRGFFPYEQAMAAEADIRPPEGRVEVIGFVRPSQTAQFFFDLQRIQGRDFPLRLLRIDLEKLRSRYPYPLEEVFLEQTDQPTGAGLFLAREEIPAARHLNYVLQWGSFALFALFLSTLWQFRRKRSTVLSQELEARP
jgi:cytochrome oxidase assembly protein ShyY1